MGAEERTGSVRRHGATFTGAAPFNRPPKITAQVRTNDWAAFRKTPVSLHCYVYRLMITTISITRVTIFLDLLSEEQLSRKFADYALGCYV